jgi:hypothetical protein
VWVGQTGFVDATSSSLYKGNRYPVEIISHCVWLYHRFPLSLREIEEMMLARGVWLPTRPSCATRRQVIEWRWETSTVGPSQRSDRSWGQPDPGNAGDGGKRPRQRRDGSVLPDGPGPASETRRCNDSEPVVEVS